MAIVKGVKYVKFLPGFMPVFWSPCLSTCLKSECQAIRKLAKVRRGRRVVFACVI